MNKVALVGRLTRDPEVRYTQGSEPLAIARYTLAVERKYKKDADQTADFISCKCFGKTAEFVEKYLHKGIKIAVAGRIQTGSYEKDGKRVYTTDVIIEEHEFCESKKAAADTPAPAVHTDADGFMEVPEGLDEELPFI